MAVTILPDLYTSLFERYQQVRLGTHLTDVILCPREAVFRQLNPKPITNKELYHFLKGRSVHEALQALAERNPAKYVAELEVWMKPNGAVAFILPEISELGRNKETFELYRELLTKAGINFDKDLQAHIDIYNKQAHFPIEAKTFDGTKLEQPKPHQLMQLRSYMALTMSDDGLIWYMYRNYNDPLKEFPIFAPSELREEQMNFLIRELKLINLAKKHKKPEAARHVARDEDLNWKCNNCKYLQECQELRKKARERV